MSSEPLKEDSSFGCKQGAVRAVRFNNDGNYCLTCGSDKSLKLWNPFRQLLLKTYCGHGYEVLDAQSSCDNSQLISCSLDKTIILWDVSSGKVIRKYRDHIGRVNSVRFNEESTVAISGSIDGTAKIWDCRSKNYKPIQVLDEAKDSVTSIDVSDHEILCGSADNRVRRYDLRMGQLFADCIGKPVTCVQFTKDGQCTLISSLDSTLRLLDKETGEMLGEYVGHKNNNYKIDCCLNNKDNLIYSGSEDGFIYCWDLVEASVHYKLSAGKKTVHSLSFHPTEECLLTACEDKVIIWKNIKLE